MLKARLSIIQTMAKISIGRVPRYTIAFIHAKNMLKTGFLLYNKDHPHPKSNLTTARLAGLHHNNKHIPVTWEHR